MSAGLQRAGSAISAMSTTSDTLMEKQLNELSDDRDSQNSDLKSEQENVAVMVRCRPPIIGGKKRPSDEIVLNVDEDNKSIRVLGASVQNSRIQSANETASQQQQNIREFYFDRVFSIEADNERVYMQSARRIVESAFNGYNCTVFLYGQTGTGKTHTHSSLTTSAFSHLFSLIQNSNQEARFLIRASYYELYNEEIHDLLASDARKSLSKALELRESSTRGVYIKDLACFLVNNPGELNKLKQLGDKRRSTAATRMNEHSSRSHSIFSITIETVSVNFSANDETSKRRPATMNNKNKKETVRLGRLNLIDLAGSERQSKTGSVGARLKEASQINLSLTCLSLVIRALTDPQSSHVPYRNSKLTRLLSSSLGGNSKTLLIACIAPEASNLDETLNTLRFASRTKKIKNLAKINEDPKDALLRKYRQQVNELRRKLHEQQQQQQQITTGQHSQQLDTLTFGDDDDGDSKVTRQQLELLKSKIMSGGENLLDKVELHERLLEASRMELEEKRQQERRLREQLEENRNRLELVQQSKGSLQSQKQQLESRLKRAISLYKRKKLEQKDLVSEHEQLKESLLQGIKATSKEIKFVDCILEDFIPREFLDLINAYAQYDDESDEWQIKYIAMSGNNIAQTTRMRLAGPVASNLASSTPSSATTLSSDNERKQPDKAVLDGKSRELVRKKMSGGLTGNNRPDPYLRMQ